MSAHFSSSAASGWRLRLCFGFFSLPPVAAGAGGFFLVIFSLPPMAVGARVFYAHKKPPLAIAPTANEWLQYFGSLFRLLVRPFVAFSGQILGPPQRGNFGGLNRPF